MATVDEYNIAGVHTYNDLLKELVRGTRFCEVQTWRDGTKNLHTVLSYDGGYIRWNQYGSSAHKPTVKDLEFIITKIFKTDIPNFIRTYVWVY